MPIIMLVIGTIVGAAVMYILDPIAGRRRRAMTRDQMLSKVHDMSDTIEAKARHYRNKARGLTAELRSKVEHKEEMPVPAGHADTMDSTSNIGM